MTIKSPLGRLFLRPVGARATLLALAAVSLSMTACKRDEVTHARVRKEQPAAATMPASMASRAGEVPPPPAPSSGDSLQWQLPSGWQESKAGGMRFATLKPNVSGKLDVSIVVLPGEAGGELANVNRWRGQIGLPPVDEAALGAARKAVKSRAGTVSVYDFTSDGTAKTRMIAGLLLVNGNSWFLKMVGDADAVASARGGFLKLLETLRLE
jgi:hypothetical protein